MTDSATKERKRLNARNTRARKKQYMEELKQRVENMHAKRADVENKKEAATREEEQKTSRWAGTVQKVLDLRCEGVVDGAVWGEVLTEDFELSLPFTPYRSYDPAEVEGGRRRVLLGVEGMISDTASLTEMCVNLAKRCRQQAGGGAGGAAGGAMAGGGSDGGSSISGRGSSSGSGGSDPPRVRLKASVSAGDLVFLSEEGDGIMCMFSMTTVNAREFGSPLEVESNGMLRAAFAEDGKLDELEMMFDGVAVHQQLQRATGGVM